MTILDTETEPPAPSSPARRAAFLAVAVGLTGVLAYLALILGAWGFDYRRYSQHNERLRRLLAHKPSIDQVVGGLHDEGSLLVASPEGEAALLAEAARRGGARAAEVIEKGRRWPHTRVFIAGDMVYFVYFDEAGIMRDFTCVSR